MTWQSKRPSLHAVPSKTFHENFFKQLQCVIVSMHEQMMLRCFHIRYLRNSHQIRSSISQISLERGNSYDFMRKRKRSDSVLWQKPPHQQKCQKGKVTTQTTPQKSSITQRLRTDLGRSVGVTTATQLVWLTGLRAHLPTNRNSRLIKRTHV